MFTLCMSGFIGSNESIVSNSMSNHHDVCFNGVGISIHLIFFHVNSGKRGWRLVQWLTGHSEGDLLCPATRLVLSHTSVGARVSFLGGAKHQIQAILVHSALCGYPLSSSLPPHFGLRSPPWGLTGHPLQRVCREDARRPWHHVIYLCNRDTEGGLES